MQLNSHLHAFSMKILWITLWSVILCTLPGKATKDGLSILAWISALMFEVAQMFLILDRDRIPSFPHVNSPECIKTNLRDKREYIMQYLPQRYRASTAFSVHKGWVWGRSPCWHVFRCSAQRPFLSSARSAPCVDGCSHHAENVLSFYFQSSNSTVDFVD